MPKMLNLLQEMNKTTKQFILLFTSTLIVIISIIATNIKSLLKTGSSGKPQVNNELPDEKIEPSRTFQEQSDIDQIKEDLAKSGILPQEAKYWKNL